MSIINHLFSGFTHLGLGRRGEGVGDFVILLYIVEVISLKRWLPQVTRSVDTEHGKLSPQEQNTVDAIVKAR